MYKVNELNGCQGGELRNSGVQRCFNQALVISLSKLKNLSHIKAHGCGDSLSVGRIRPVAVNCMAIFDVFSYRFNVACRVLNEQIFLFVCHYPPQVAACTETVICGIILGIIGIHCARQIQRRFHNFRLGCPLSLAVG